MIRNTSNDPKYLPSEEEIRDACREIQSTWSESEARSRYPQEPWYTFQERRLIDFCVG